MAKKRTLVPFYGKANQRLEAMAAAAAKAGDTQEADGLLMVSKALVLARRNRAQPKPKNKAEYTQQQEDDGSIRIQCEVDLQLTGETY